MPLEVSLLTAVTTLQAAGVEPYGFLLAKHLAAGRPGALTAHGTLYKALARLVAGGMLESAWESPDVAESEGRPRRRLYRVTGVGATELSRAQAREETQQRATSVLRPVQDLA